MTRSCEARPLFDVPSEPSAPREWLPAPAGSSAPRPAENAVAVARAEGFADGQRAAMADTEQLRLRLESATVLFEAAAGALQRRSREAVMGEAHEIADLCYRLVETLLQRELRMEPQPWRDAVRRALAEVDPKHQVVLRLHPEDLRQATPATMEALTQAGESGALSVELISDPQVELGGCVADVGPTRFDAQIGPALRRLAVVLDVLPDPEPQVGPAIAESPIAAVLSTTTAGMQ